VSEALAPGSVIQGRYRIERPLGEGAMASAWLAWDALGESRVALKLVHASRPELALLLRAEFARLRGLEHPHLARVRDLGVLSPDDPRPFYTADAIRGEALSRWAEGRTPEAILGAVCDALTALALLHSLEIAHGDFKPDNVLVREDGRGVLVDLGCAGVIGARFHGSGTPGFIAPELVRGGSLSRRSDLFAVGVTLERTLGTVPARLRDVIARLTASDPSRRPADVAELWDALEQPAPLRMIASGRARALVGRDASVARFRGLLEHMLASSSAPRVLWLHGPDGIGRSRLLQELEWIAQERTTVIEGSPRAPLGDLLGASGGLDAMLEAIERERAGAPKVLVLDDAHLLAPIDAARLRAVVRTLGEHGAILLVCASRDAAGIEGAALEAIPALDVPALSEWTGALLSARGVEELARVTGGVPAYVEAVLARVASGALKESELSRGSPAGRAEAIADAAWARLTEDERRALARLAIDDGTPELDDVLARLPDWVSRGERGFRFARALDGAFVLSAMEPARLAALHAAAATRSGIDRASAVWHLARAGQIDRASREIVEARASFEAAPAAWARAAREVALCTSSEIAKLAAADALSLAGQPAEALTIVARVVRARPDAVVSAEARRVAGAAYLRLGRLARAERQLAKARELATDPRDRAAVLDLLSRTLVLRGRYAEARAAAEEGARSVPSAGPLAAALEEDIGVAAAYVGEIELARRHLARALELHGADQGPGTPRVAVRIASYAALAEYRGGRFGEAAEGYRRALAIAREHGIDDQLASALTNLGTVEQQLGEWGSALQSYERALALASALGKQSTVASLRFNLANLYAGAGALDRARELLTRLRAEAAQAGAALPAGAADLLEGEIALASGGLDAAARALDRARASFGSLSAERDRLEAELGLAAVALARGDRVEAARRAREVQARAREPDVAARAALILGRAERSLARLEEALRSAQSSGRRDLVAEVHAALAGAARESGAAQLAQEHARRARAEWERIAATLPEHLRADFWARPERAAVPASHESAPRSEGAQLRRILEINRRLGEARSADRVIEAALDAAIELSGAERGFALLVEESELRVAAARNLDRERVGRSHLKFSRGIAESVVESGEPVLTTDARADERFLGNESVHAMRLRSVACVPIRGSESVLGAIYVDHRFESARFESADLSILLAFADQVAIALASARLTAVLEARTRELEAEKKRVEAIAAEQAREIDRLGEEARARKQELSYRYDYASIVGRSRAMRSVLSVLERVIDSSLSVLIRGESGTGKELVARCVHFNGARKDGPFVAINCAAMPETLLESELFGYRRGAFSGAERDHEGLFVRARGGTLFLDELGETSPSMQAKLLRVLQDRTVRPLGASEDHAVDFRLVCATNRDLRAEIERGRFREDLYFRVAVVEIVLPALRDRGEDIPELAEALLERAAREHGRDEPRLTPRALGALTKHDWPGNVRELENVLQRAIVMCSDGVIDARDLALGEAKKRAKPATRAEFEQDERESISRALEAARWNVSDACRALGMPRTTFYRKLARYGLLR
jgi:serine/threonine-protein kinase PknK